MTMVYAAPARAALQHCARLGLDTTAILTATHLSRASLDAVDARIPVSTHRALWAEVQARTQDPLLGLSVAEAAPVGSFGVLHFLCANAPTVGSAFELIAEFAQLCHGGFSAAVRHDACTRREEAGSETVVFDVSSGLQCGSEVTQCALFTAAMCYLGVLRSTGVSFAPVFVELAVAAPRQRLEARRLFGGDVVFGAARTRLRFERATWERAVPGGNPTLRTLLRAHAGHLMEAVPAQPPLLDQVRAAVDSALASGAPSTTAIAWSLGMSTRTLQRELHALGTTYSEVLDGARRDRAHALLGDRGLPISEIALALGFSEQSAFTRAYRRWTGTPPAHARKLGTGTGR